MRCALALTGTQVPALIAAAPRPPLADPCAADARGDTPAMALARQGAHRPLAELLRLPAAAAAVDGRDAGGRTALHPAAAAGAFTAVWELRAHGADASLRTWEEPQGRTAAELASAGGHAACLPLLKAAELPGRT